MVQSRSTIVELGESTPLKAHTQYNVSYDACTAGGCTRSPTISVSTESAEPRGLAAPLITNITQTSVSLMWSPPEDPNGEIVRYHFTTTVIYLLVVM